MKIIMYTSITANKDAPRTDILNINNYDKFVNPAMNAKIPKILSHLFVDCDISIWIDGCIFPQISAEEFVNLYLPQNVDMALFKHPERNCIYEEGPVALGRCVKDSAQTKIDINNQLAYYRSLGFPPNSGLAECNFIIRRHNDNVINMNEAWWGHICRFSRRDQLSFPVIIQRFPNLKINYLSGNIRYHPHFKCSEHLWF